MVPGKIKTRAERRAELVEEIIKILCPDLDLKYDLPVSAGQRAQLDRLLAQHEETVRGE